MSLALALVVAFLSGFISLSGEVLWYRAYSFVSEGWPPAFGLMLGCYLAGIAAGAAGARRVCGREGSSGDARFLAPLGAFVLAANALSFLVVPLLARISTVAPWWASLPVLALAAGALGAILPLASHFGVAPDDRAGSGVSRIFAANIAGSTLGTLLTGYVLMDVWTLRGISVFLAVLGCLLAAAVFSRAALPPGKRFAALGACAAAAVLAFALQGPLFDRIWERMLFHRTFGDWAHFAVVKENRNDVICVTNDGLVFGGGVYDGVVSTSPSPDPNGIWRAYALAGFHEAPRDVLVVGLSGGAWTQVLAHMPGVERVVVVEINPGYLDVIARYPHVASLLRNPKVEIAIDDGRRWLRRHPDRRFDLVVQNTPQHWRAHATHLLAREHFELVRSRLRPGGRFYFNTTDSPEAQATALAVFPHAVMLWNFLLAGDTPVVPDAARMRASLRAFAIDGAPVWDFSGPGEEGAFEEALGKCLGAVPREEIEKNTSVAPVITDDNMASEWARWGRH